MGNMKGIKLGTTLVLVLMLVFGTAWTALPNIQGAIHTTNDEGTKINHFDSLEDVYFDAVSNEFEFDEYYVQITKPNGKTIVLGSSENKVNMIKDGGPYQVSKYVQDGTLKAGVYKLMISIDPDFDPSFTKSDNFIIRGGGNDTQPDTGTIVIIKTLESEDGDPHEDVTFNLYRKEPMAMSIAIEYPLTGVTNEEGEIVFDGLEIGEYIIKEVVPDGYTSSISKDGEVVKVEAGVIKVIRVTNSKIEEPEEPEEPEELGSLTIKYVDEEGEELSETIVKRDLPFGEYIEEAIEIEGYILKGDLTQRVTLDAETPDQEIVFVYEKIEVIEEEEPPLGPTDPKDPEDEEVIIEEEEVPLGGAKLPQTGGLPPVLYYGTGAVLTMIGGILRRKK